jgi:beta-glucosidase/6-phospho-beta-glucosidase/beta-galactosidase
VLRAWVIAPLAQGWAASSRRAETVAPNTYNQRLASLSSFYQYAIKHDVLSTNPITRVERRLVVTESGAAFDDHRDGNGNIHDQQRIHYLQGHIQTVAQVIRQGVPIKGYVVWSFLDNFEWSEGYRKRFGLVYVDYPTQRRIVKDSGRWYASFVASQRESRP